eukprot:SAG11_NODE_4376_length_1925_cov_2.550931_2_plen_74_part_00
MTNVCDAPLISEDWLVLRMVMMQSCPIHCFVLTRLTTLADDIVSKNSIQVPPPRFNSQTLKPRILSFSPDLGR